MSDGLPPLRRETDAYPKDAWSVVGYVLVHPRTWILILAAVVAWQCLGLREFVDKGRFGHHHEEAQVVPLLKESETK